MLIEERVEAQPEAFGALVVRYRRLVTAMVARTVCASTETEDLVQDVFLEAYRKLHTLRDKSRFKAWLVTLAMNKARSWGRRKRVEVAALPRIARSGVTGPQNQTERDEQRVRMLAALRELPAEAQVVVTLRYLEGQSSPQIAETLGISPEAVRMRLSRALRVLRTRLKDKNG